MSAKRTIWMEAVTNVITDVTCSSCCSFTSHIFTQPQPTTVAPEPCPYAAHAPPLAVLVRCSTTNKNCPPSQPRIHSISTANHYLSSVQPL